MSVDDNDIEDKCKICFVNEADALFTPCNHLAYCPKCLIQSMMTDMITYHRQPRCAICRTDADGYVVIGCGKFSIPQIQTPTQVDMQQ